ncbi:MAG: acyl-CoA dehydrogenase family protein [Bacteroidota bacterium]
MKSHHIPLMSRAVRVQKEALRIIGENLARKIQARGDIKPGAFNCAQVQSTELARFLAENAAAEALVAYGENEQTGEFERQLIILYISQSVVNFAKHMQFEYGNFGFLSAEPLEELFEMANHLRLHNNSAAWVHLGEMILDRERDLSGSPALDTAHIDYKEMFSRFSDEVIAPIAETTHREDRIIPDSILKQLGELGVFGISIPEQYGGIFSDHLVMIIATEELSRGSLGAGGSVLTRPEICAKALLAGGTEEQKRTWLPKISTGEKMVCVAVTEPNTGSDVASVSVTATRTEGGYVINGEKTWVTFGGRSDVFCLLARTGSVESGHKGLSLFLVEKPADAVNESEYYFKHTQPKGGVVEGRAIPTIGYRGMHSFAVAFDNYFVPQENLIGEEGRGFYLQMQGFAGGRIQTAARALGVMEAAFRAAISYVKSRKVFGQPLADFTLTKYKLGQMAARIQANRQLAYKVAALMDEDKGGTEASLVKLLACKDAEWVTREAMQLHGGMGYSEEYAVSRYFLDARVLSIFEGAEEVLALQVIARPYLQQFIKD